MRFTAAAFFATSLGFAVAGCEVVTPTNPFDPATPPDQQQLGQLAGKVVLQNPTSTEESLAIELAALRVKLLDSEGRALQADGADVKHELVDVDASAGDVGRGGFVFDDVVPGAYTVVVEGVASFYRAPVIVPITVVPGGLADAGEFVFVFDGNGDCGPGSIAGTVDVEDAAAGQRDISLFVKAGDGVRFVDAVVSGDGDFAFSCLPTGTYALVGESEGFTPDFRLNINVGETEGAALSQTFDGEDALRLFPVTAVLLPQNAGSTRTGPDGTFVSGDDASLAVLAFGGVSQMRLSTSASFLDAGGNDLPFQPYAATVSQPLPAREGQITIFAQFQVRSDDDAFVFTSEAFSTAVVRDVSAPEVLGLSLGELRSDGAVLLADDAALAATVDGQDVVSAVDAVSLDVDGVGGDVFDSIVSAGGRVLIPRALNLAADGEHVVTAVVRDRAGNLSAPVSVRVLLDQQAPDVDVVVDNADNGVLHERRAALTLTDNDGDAVLMNVALVRASGDEEALVDDAPFSPSLELALPTPNDAEPVTVRVSVSDRVGNVTVVETPALTLSLRARIAGRVVKDGVPDVEADHGGVAVSVVDGAGAVLGSAESAADGSFVVAGVGEAVGVVVVASKDGWQTARRTLGVVSAQVPGAPPLDADRLDLPLLTGTLVVNARLDEAAADDTAHAGIIVRARLTGGRSFERVDVTGDDGDVRFSDLPATLAGETYVVTASADRHQPVTTTTSVPAGVVTTTQALRLSEVSGAFDICAGASGACTPASFVNTAQVRVRLRGAVATAIRARAGDPILPTTSEQELPFQPIANAGADVVDIGALADGVVSVFVQFQTGADATSDVLTATVTKDTVAPDAPSVVVNTAAGALDARFTAFGNVDLVVDGDAGAGAVAPLARARVVVADAAPAVAPAIAGQCDDGRTCTIALPTVAGAVVEKLHRLHAFACDQAGNCSAPSSTFVIHDRTPPGAGNGASFSVDAAGSAVVGGVRVLRSALYTPAIGTGTAKDGNGSTVRLDDNSAVADVFGYRLSFLSSGVDVPVRTLSPSALPGQTRNDVVAPALQNIEADQTVFAVLVDAAGNASATPLSVTLRIDASAPDVGFALAAVDGNVVATTTDQVRLLVTPGVETPARVQLDLDADGAFDDADLAFPFVGGADVQRLIGASDGRAIVGARFVDAVGNASVRSASILVDRQAPDVLALTCATCRVVNGALFSNAANAQETLNVVANDGAGSGTEKLSITVNGGAPTVVSSPSTAAVLLSANVSNTVVVKAVDRAGNTSALAQSRSLTIVHDNTKPTFAVVVAGGVDVVKTPDVVVAINNASADVVGMRLSSTSTFSGPDLPFNPTTTFTLPFPDALRTVFVELSDSAGNRDVRSDDVRLDTVAPNGALVVANNGGFVTTSTLSVNATLDGATRFALGAEPFTCPTTLPATPAFPQSQGPFGDGAVTLVGCFGDDAGNVAQSRLTVTVDTQAPNAKIAVDNGATFSTDTAVDVNVSDAADVVAAVFAEGAINCATATLASFDRAVTPTVALSSAAPDGARTVTACFADRAGNRSSASDTILLDRADPSGALSVASGAAFVRGVPGHSTDPVDVNVDVIGASADVVGVAVGVPDVACNTAVYAPFSPLLRVSFNADGNTTVAACLKDAAGRTSKITDAIVVDRVPPVGAVTLNDGAATVTSLQVTGRFTVDADVTAVALVAGDQDCERLVANDFAAISALSPPLTKQVVLAGGGPQIATACFRDAADNRSRAGDAIEVDLSALNQVEVIAGGGAAFSRSSTVVLNVLAPSDAQTSKVVVDASNVDANGNNVVDVCESAVGFAAFNATPNVTGLANGLRTIGVCVKTPTRTLFDDDSIEVDTVVPTGTLVINAGAARTKNELVLVDLTFAADVDAVAVSNAPTIDCNTASFEPAVATKTVQLPGPDNEVANTLRACLRDRAGNTAVVSDDIVFDRLPPQGVAAAVVDDTSSPAPSAGFVHKTAVKARLTLGTGTTQVAVAEGGLDCDVASFANASGASVDIALTLSSGDATKSITACFKDVVGNISSATASTVLDTANPVGRVVLQNGADTVSSRVNVAVALDAPADVHLASVVEAATLNCNTATYQAFAQNGVITLSAGDAQKTVSVCFKDDAGRTALAQDTILLDETRPTGTLTLTGNGQTGFTNSTQIGAAISSSDAVEMALSTSTLDCDNTAYAAFATTAALTLPSGDGSKSVNLCLRDRAGNRSLLISSSITLDQTPPAAATHSVAVNAGAAFATSQTATLTINFAADAVERAVGNDGLDCSSATYTALPGTSPQTVSNFALSAGDGVKVVAVCFRDRAKNTTLATDTIELDSAPPSALDTSLTINAGAARTASTTLSLTLQVPNDVDGVAYQEGALSQSACDALSTFEAPTSPRTFVLSSSTEGTKTVSACVREKAGRRLVVTDAVFLDPTRPTLTSVTLDGLIGGTTRDRVVDVGVVGASADVVAIAVADAHIADCAAVAYVPFTATFTRQLVAGDGPKVVSVCLKDETGNVSAASSDGTITLDGTPPAGAAVDVPALTSAASVTATLTYASTGPNAATSFAVAEGAIDCSTAARSALDGGSPDTKNLTLSTGDGAKSVVACFYDDAGNFTAAVPDTVVLDTKAPVVTAATCANCTVDGATLFLTSTTTTNIAVSSDEAGSGVAANALVSVDGGADVARAIAGGVVNAGALGNGAAHTVRVRLQDNAGNVTAVADSKTLVITVDATAPALVSNADFRLNGANSGLSTSSTSVNVTINNPPADATQMAIAEGALSCATASYVPLSPAFTFNLSGATQSTRTLSFCMKDRAGNTTTTAATASITFDTVPPALPGSNAVVIDNADADNNANAFLTSTAGLRILLDWNTAGDVVAFKVNEAFADCSEPMERPVNIATIDSFVKTDFVLSTVDGNHVVFACFKDAAGNTVTSSASAVLDQVGANGAVVVNGGNAFTTNAAEDVSVVLRMGDDTARFALQETANASCTTPTLNCATASYVSVSGATVVDGALQQTVSQNLNGNPATQGAKCFEACFEDVAGNRTASASLDGITFDTVAPSAAASLAGLTLTAGQTRSPFVTLTLTGAPADVAQMRVSEDSGFLGGTVPFDAFAATRSIALSPNDGSKTINVQLKDNAGNVSTLAISASIVLDTQPPSGTAVVINNGAAATSSSTVSVFIQASGATERLILTPDNPADTEVFQTFAISPTTVGGVVIENGATAADDGSKTVLVVFRDAAGNEAAAAVDTIDLDRAAPTVASLSCGAGTASGVCINNGASATNSVSASLTLAATGATEMSIAADGCADNEADEPFVPFSTAITTLLDGSTQGAKTVAVRFRDAAGNVSQTFSSCATTPGHTAAITFDTVAPSGVAVALVSTVGTDPSGFTTSGNANGTFTRGDATSFKHGQAVDCSTAAGYAAISGTTATVSNIPLLGGAGFKSYFACFKDDAGNVTSATTSITVDNVVPTGTMVLANAATIIGTSATTATLTFSNDVTGVLVTTTNPTTCPTAAGSYVPAQAELNVTLSPAGSGTRTAFACLRDAAGNVSSVLSDSVDVDVTPPSLSITVNGASVSPITTNNTTVTLGVTASDASAPVQMSISNTPLSCATANYTTLSAVVQHQIPVSASTTINVCARDALGVTTTTPATFLVNLDQTGPTATFEIQKTAGTSTELTNSLSANLRVNTSESGVTRRFVNDVADCSSGTFVALGTGNQDVAHTLSNGDGTKTVFACLKDSVGNVTVASDTIVLDTLAPAGATFALNGGADITTATTVTGVFTNITDVSQMRFFLGALPGGACPTPFTGYAAFSSGSNVPLTLTGGATNTVFACLADAAGNVAAVSDAIEVDTSDPSLTFTLGRRGTPSPDPTFTNSRAITVKVTALSAAAGSSIAIAQGALTCTAATTSYTPLPNPLPATPFNIDFDLTAGGAEDTRTVTVCVKEPSTRTNGASGTSGTITLDTTPPAVTLSINGGSSITATDVVALSFAPSPAADPLRFSTSRVPTEDCAAATYGGAFGTVTGLASFTLDNSSGTDDSGTKFAVGCFQDRAGNTAAAIDDIFFDEDRPGFGSLRPVCSDCNLVDATPSFADTFGDESLGFFNSANGAAVFFDVQSTSSDVVNVLTLATTDTDQSQANGLGEDRVCVDSSTCSAGESCRLFPAKDSPQLLLKRCVFVSPADTVSAVPLAGEGKKSLAFALEDTAGNLSNGRNLFVVRDTVPATAATALTGTKLFSTAIASIDDSGAGGTVVIAFANNHALGVGESIVVAGTNGGGATYDGAYTVAAIETPSRIRTVEVDPGADNDIARTVGTVTSTITRTQSVFIDSITISGETAQPGVLRLGTFRASSLSTLSDAATLNFTDVASPFVLTDDLPVTMTAGDGPKTIFVEFTDNAGNVTTTTQGTTLDGTAPSDPQWANATTLIDGATGVAIAPLAVTSSDPHLTQPKPYVVSGFNNTTGLAVDTDLSNCQATSCEWNGTGAFTVAASNLAEGENRLRVNATDVAGNLTNIDFFIVTKDSQRPPAPTNLRKAERSTAVTFTWDRSTSTDVDGYLVHYGATPLTDGGTFADQGPSPLFVRQPPGGAPQVDFTLTGLVDNSPLSVSITAVDLVGNESVGALGAVALPNPVAPVQVAIGATAPGNGTQGNRILQAVGPRLYVFEAVDATNSRLCAYDTASGSMTRLGCSANAPVPIADAHLVVHGRNAYVSNKNGNHGDNLRHFDVGNPAAITGPSTLDINNDSTDTRTIGTIDDNGAGGTVIMTTTTTHNFAVGDQIEVSGVAAGTYNGFYTVLQIISTTSIRTVEVDPGNDNDAATTGGTVKTHDGVLDFVIPGRFAVGLLRSATASGGPTLRSQAYMTPLNTSGNVGFDPLGSPLDEAVGNFSTVRAFDTDGQRIVMLYDTTDESGALRTRTFVTTDGPPNTKNPLGSGLDTNTLTDNKEQAIVLSNGFVFAGGDAGLRIYSTGGSSMTLIGARAGFSCDTIDVAGGYAFCNDKNPATASRLFVIDVSNAFIPKLVGRALQGTGAGTIVALRQNEGHLYAVSQVTGTTRQIEDIELTSAARLNSTAAFGATVRDIGGHRNSVYTAEEGGVVCLTGVANAEDPAVINCGSTGATSTVDTQLALSAFVPVEHDLDDAANAFRVHDPQTLRTTIVAPIPASGICSGVGGAAITLGLTTYGNFVITLQSGGALQSWDLTRRDAGGVPAVTCISELVMSDGTGPLSDNTGLTDISNVVDGRFLVSDNTATGEVYAVNINASGILSRPGTSLPLSVQKAAMPALGPFIADLRFNGSHGWVTRPATTTANADGQIVRFNVASGGAFSGAVTQVKPSGGIAAFGTSILTGVGARDGGNGLGNVNGIQVVNSANTKIISQSQGLRAMSRGVLLGPVLWTASTAGAESAFLTR